MLRKIIFVGLLLSISASGGWCSEDDRWPVAIFNNSKIYLEDLQLTGELKQTQKASLSTIKFEQFEYTYRMEMLARWIHSKLRRRILAEYGYTLTDEELDAYLKHTGQKRSRLTKEKLRLIRSQIWNWHFDSILYSKYQGRTIKLPSGRIKPVEAYYRQIQELMEKKVLFFTDINYRAALTILELYFERDPHPEADELESTSYFLQPNWGGFNQRYFDLPITERYRIKNHLKYLDFIKHPR